MYKINLHAHTIFSDGSNTPYVMALKAKEMGFSALVITDHFYANMDGGGLSLNIDRWRSLRLSAHEVKDNVMPIIVGMEMTYGGEEILVFGSQLIPILLEWYTTQDGNYTRGLPIDEFIALKKEHNAAIILAHPMQSHHWDFLAPLLDGFEMYNSGQNMFKGRDYGALNGMTAFSNSDAHSVDGLEWGYNITDVEIVDEYGLIQYIKSGAQPDLEFAEER